MVKNNNAKEIHTSLQQLLAQQVTSGNKPLNPTINGARNIFTTSAQPKPVAQSTSTIGSEGIGGGNLQVHGILNVEGAGNSKTDIARFKNGITNIENCHFDYSGGGKQNNGVTLSKFIADANTGIVHVTPELDMEGTTLKLAANGATAESDDGKRVTIKSEDNSYVLGNDNDKTMGSNSTTLVAAQTRIEDAANYYEGSSIKNPTQEAVKRYTDGSIEGIYLNVGGNSQTGGSVTTFRTPQQDPATQADTDGDGVLEANPELKVSLNNTAMEAVNRRLEFVVSETIQVRQTIPEDNSTDATTYQPSTFQADILPGSIQESQLSSQSDASVASWFNMINRADGVELDDGDLSLATRNAATNEDHTGNAAVSGTPQSYAAPLPEYYTSGGNLPTNATAITDSEWGRPVTKDTIKNSNVTFQKIQKVPRDVVIVGGGPGADVGATGSTGDVQAISLKGTTDVLETNPNITGTKYDQAKFLVSGSALATDSTDMASAPKSQPITGDIRVAQGGQATINNLSVQFEKMQKIPRNSVLIGSSKDTGAANFNLNNKLGSSGLITSVGMDVNDILVGRPQPAAVNDANPAVPPTKVNTGTMNATNAVQLAKKIWVDAGNAVADFGNQTNDGYDADLTFQSSIGAVNDAANGINLPAIKEHAKITLRSQVIKRGNLVAGADKTAQEANQSIIAHNGGLHQAPTGQISVQPDSLSLHVEGTTGNLQIQSSVAGATGLTAAGVATAHLQDEAVNNRTLNTEVAGGGLVGGAGTALSVNTDGLTLEVSTDAVQIKQSTAGASGLAAAGVATAHLQDEAVNNRTLNTEVAGGGLVGGAGTALSVNTDGLTLEVSTDAVQIKQSTAGASGLAAAGVATAHLQDDAVTITQLGGPAKDRVNAGFSFGDESKYATNQYTADDGTPETAGFPVYSASNTGSTAKDITASATAKKVNGNILSIDLAQLPVFKPKAGDTQLDAAAIAAGAPDIRDITAAPGAGQVATRAGTTFATDAARDAVDDQLTADDALADANTKLNNAGDTTVGNYAGAVSVDSANRAALQTALNNADTRIAASKALVTAAKNSQSTANNSKGAAETALQEFVTANAPGIVNTAEDGTQTTAVATILNGVVTTQMETAVNADLEDLKTAVTNAYDAVVAAFDNTKTPLENLKFDVAANTPITSTTALDTHKQNAINAADDTITLLTDAENKFSTTNTEHGTISQTLANFVTNAALIGGQTGSTMPFAATNADREATHTALDGILANVTNQQSILNTAITNVNAAFNSAGDTLPDYSTFTSITNAFTSTAAGSVTPQKTITINAIQDSADKYTSYDNADKALQQAQIDQASAAVTLAQAKANAKNAYAPVVDTDLDALIDAVTTNKADLTSDISTERDSRAIIYNSSLTATNNEIIKYNDIDTNQKPVVFSQVNGVFVANDANRTTNVNRINALIDALQVKVIDVEGARTIFINRINLTDGDNTNLNDIPLTDDINDVGVKTTEATDRINAYKLMMTEYVTSYNEAVAAFNTANTSIGTYAGTAANLTPIVLPTDAASVTQLTTDVNTNVINKLPDLKQAVTNAVDAVTAAFTDANLALTHVVEAGGATSITELDTQKTDGDDRVDAVKGLVSNAKTDQDTASTAITDANTDLANYTPAQTINNTIDDTMETNINNELETLKTNATNSVSNAFTQQDTADASLLALRIELENRSCCIYESDLAVNAGLPACPSQVSIQEAYLAAGFTSYSPYNSAREANLVQGQLFMTTNSNEPTTAGYGDSDTLTGLAGTIRVWLGN